MIMNTTSDKKRRLTRTSFVEAIHEEHARQLRIDAVTEVNPRLRKLIVGETRDIAIFAILAITATIPGALVTSWLFGWVFDLAGETQERLFWIIALVQAPFFAAQFMYSSAAERSVYWARAEEIAERGASLATAILRNLGEKMEHDFPELSSIGFSASDATPLVDVALSSKAL